MPRPYIFYFFATLYKKNTMKNLFVLLFCGLLLFTSNISTAQNLPASYDPRTLDLVTPVVTQGASNNCWIYSSVTSLEMHRVKKYGISTSYSRSFYDYRKAGNGFAENGVNQVNPMGVAALNSAGIGSITVLPIFVMMINWHGPVLQSEFPDNTSGNPPRIPLSQMEISAVTGLPYTRDFHVYGYDYISSRDSAERVQDIKEAVYNNGAATFSTGNHQVGIIGWDDERVNDDGSKGGFLYKDNYGTGRGDGGHIWISYNNANITMRQNLSINHIEPVGKYYKNYHHMFYTELSGELTGSNTASLANVFTRERSDESIEAVGFSTFEKNTKYEIYINPDGADLNSSSLIKVEEGLAEKAGHRTISFPAKAITGEKFAVVVKFIQPEGVNNFQLELQRSSNVPAGIGFYNRTGDINSGWTDASIPAVFTSGASAFSHFLPIRAYTNHTGVNTVEMNGADYLCLNTAMEAVEA